MFGGDREDKHAEDIVSFWSINCYIYILFMKSRKQKKWNVQLQLLYKNSY